MNCPATLLDNYGLRKIEYLRILRAVQHCVERGIDGREISRIVSRREGYPEWKIDAALHLRAELAERQVAAMQVAVRNTLDRPIEVEREFWEAA